MNEKKALMASARNNLANIQAGLLDYLSEGIRVRREFLDDADVEHLGMLVKAFSMTQEELDYFYGEDPEFDELIKEE